MKGRCMDCGLSNKAGHALDTNRLGSHCTQQENLYGPSKQNYDLVAFSPRRNLRSDGHKLAIDKMTPAQQTLNSAFYNSCSTASPNSIGIQYPGTFNRKNSQKDIEVHELDSDTSHDGLSKLRNSF